MASSRTVIVSIILAGALCASAGLARPLTHDFAEGPGGWTLPEGCQAPGGDRDALSLHAGWAISPAADAPVTGWQRVQIRAAAPEDADDSRLLVALIGADEAPVAQVAVSAAETGGGWHDISAELLAPGGGATSLAVGVEDQHPWLVRRVNVEAVELPVTEASGEPPVIPEPLPADWQPDGLLDAIERPIARQSELLVNAGSLQITVPPRVTAKRGHRGTVRLIVNNRASTEKSLTVSVTGPPGFFVPERTVTIRPNAGVRFNASLQAFFIGTRHARVTFRSGDEQASAPIEVEVTPSYPAPGVAFTADPPPGLSRMFAGRHIPLVATSLTPELPEGLTRLRLIPPPWSDEVLQSAAEQAADRADFMALYHPPGAETDGDALRATRRLRSLLDEAPEPVYTLGPPLDLQPGPPPGISDDHIAVAGELGGAGSISAPTLRLPILRARPVRAVRLDDRDVRSAQPAWTDLNEALDITHIPTAIRRAAKLPMFFADISAADTGSDACNAALLARTLIVSAWQGATGWTIPARPRDAPDGADAFCLMNEDGNPNGAVAAACRELSRELAAAVPLTILKQTPEIGTAPGAKVGFRPFMRNDEGIIALWNNTGAPVDLVCGVRTQPLDMHTVSIGPGGVRRGYEGAWHFSEKARRLNRPVVFVTLQPAEVKVLSMQLANAHIGWLSSVEWEPKIPSEREGPKSFLEDWKERNIY